MSICVCIYIHKYSHWTHCSLYKVRINKCSAISKLYFPLNIDSTDAIYSI